MGHCARAVYNVRTHTGAGGARVEFRTCTLQSLASQSSLLEGTVHMDCILSRNSGALCTSIFQYVTARCTASTVRYTSRVVTGNVPTTRGAFKKLINTVSVATSH